MILLKNCPFVIYIIMWSVGRVICLSDLGNILAYYLDKTTLVSLLYRVSNCPGNMPKYYPGNNVKILQYQISLQKLTRNIIINNNHSLQCLLLEDCHHLVSIIIHSSGVHFFRKIFSKTTVPISRKHSLNHREGIYFSHWSISFQNCMKQSQST